ncbi:ribonuclease III [Crocinitomix catalasitica]|uniref:ribonuclease III n=1 Tax=Crocinitomix catalasitica TaxID=184607 RepID=UPI000688C2D1|nr:ribonuclease III [Crocinitomix catalasitica]
MKITKFFSKSKNSEFQELNKFVTKKFSYKPKDIQLFATAFTHKSYSNSRENVESNERLEYLGDTVIDLIVAQYLFEKFPEEDEGYLTKVKSKIVNRKMLASIGGEIGLVDHLRYRTGRSIKIETIEGNALEAIIGAMYLDSNFEKTKAVFEKCIIKRYINFTVVLEQEIDFKSQLLIWGQKNKFNISFEIIDDASKENNFIYTAIVIVNENKWGQGKGTSKKEAEQQASNETMTLLGLQ